MTERIKTRSNPGKTGLVDAFHKMGIDREDMVVLASIMATLEAEVRRGGKTEIKDLTIGVKGLVGEWKKLVEAFDGKDEVERLLRESGQENDYKAHREWVEADGNLP